MNTKQTLIFTSIAAFGLTSCASSDQKQDTADETRGRVETWSINDKLKEVETPDPYSFAPETQIYRFSPDFPKELSAYIVFNFYGPSDQSDYKTRTKARIWDPGGKTYAKISFPDSDLSESRTFELSMDPNRTTNAKRWENTFGFGTYTQYSTYYIEVAWSGAFDLETIKEKYQTAKLQLWNTSSGMIYDLTYEIVSWYDVQAGRTIAAYCNFPGNSTGGYRCSNYNVAR